MLMKYFRSGDGAAPTRTDSSEAARQRTRREAARARIERALRAALQLAPQDEVMIRETLCGQAECGGVETFIRIRRTCGDTRSATLPGPIDRQGVAETGHAIFALAGYRGAQNPFDVSGAKGNAGANP